MRSSLSQISILIKACFSILLFGFLIATIDALQAQTEVLKFEIVTERFANLGGAEHMLQDRYGFIWIGTGYGLRRFDGYRVLVYLHDSADSLSLSENSITAMIEDKDGSLWIGTINGLNELNPATGKFKRFKNDPQNQNSLSDNYVTSLCLDHSGKLWIGTQEGGLNELTILSQGDQDRPHFQRHLHDPTDSSSLSDNYVRFILDDTLNTKQVLWIGTARGLNAFDKDTNKFVRYYKKPHHANKLISDDLYSIHQDSLGNLWLGAAEGCLSHLRMEKGGDIQFDHFRLGMNQKIYHITEDKSGDLWLSTFHHGLYRFVKKTRQIVYYDKDKWGHKEARSVATTFIDRSGTFWLGTWPYLYKHDPNQKQFKFIAIDPPPTIWSMAITSLYLDKDNTLWIGTYGRGVLKYNLRSGQVGSFAPDSISKRYLSSRFVQTIIEDHAGVVWVATFHGLNRYNKRQDRFEQYYWDPDQPDNPKNLISNYLYCLHEDRQGNLWIGSARGLSRLDRSRSQFTHYLNRPEQINLIGHYIGAILQDRNGTLWIGGKGLFQFDSAKNELIRYFDVPNDSSSAIDAMVFDIFEDTPGNIWVATLDGLYRLHQDQPMIHYAEKNGLPNRMVTAIIEDDQGCLWIGTIFKMTRYDPRANRFRTFDLEKEGFVSNSCFKGKAGELYFGQHNGFLSFDPMTIQDNPRPPPVWISDFRVFDQPVSFDQPIPELKDIRLSYRQNFFTLDFVALNYTESQKNQYAYQLKGVDPNWVYCGTRRSASYTNIPPGKYRFQVKASNNDGVWNEQGASIRVIITPPWWRTVWAYASYALLFVASVLGTIRFEVNRHRKRVEAKLREEQERRRLEEAEHRAVVAELQARAVEAEKEIEKEQMRSRIAGDLHDEIGSNLSTIAIVGQIAADKLQAADTEKRRLQEIPRLARQTAESMRDIIWFINPENDSMDKLIVKMRQTANLMLEQMDFTFDTPAAEISFAADVNFRRNLYLIYKECLQNIIKHAQATKVEIEISEGADCFQFRVSDNGIGFDVAREYAGNGLKNFVRRGVEMGASIEITSSKGHGTSIFLDAKIP